MIEIDKNWKVGSDSMNIILYRRKTGISNNPNMKSKGDKWGAFGYYSTFHYLLESLLNQEIRDTDLKDIKTVISKIDEVKKSIESLPDIKLSDFKGEV